MAQDCSERKFFGKIWCSVFLQGDPEARAERRSTRQSERDAKKEAKQAERDYGSSDGGGGFWASIWQDDPYVFDGGLGYNPGLNFGASTPQDDEKVFDMNQLLAAGQNKSDMNPAMILGGAFLLIMVMTIMMKK